MDNKKQSRTVIVTRSSDFVMGMASGQSINTPAPMLETLFALHNTSETKLQEESRANGNKTLRKHARGKNKKCPITAVTVSQQRFVKRVFLYLSRYFLNVDKSRSDMENEVVDLCEGISLDIYIARGVNLVVAGFLKQADIKVATSKCTSNVYKVNREMLVYAEKIVKCVSEHLELKSKLHCPTPDEQLETDIQLHCKQLKTALSSVLKPGTTLAGWCDVDSHLSREVQHALDCLVLHSIGSMLRYSSKQVEKAIKISKRNPTIGKNRFCDSCLKPKCVKFKCKRCLEDDVSYPHYYCSHECQVSAWDFKHKRFHSSIKKSKQYIISTIINDAVSTLIDEID